jgi:hypothetical protein
MDWIKLAYNRDQWRALAVKLGDRRVLMEDPVP